MKKKKILIVEDNPELLSLYQRVVGFLGYDSVIATGGRQAVSSASFEVPDLIMLDIMLPEIDGLEAARLIRKDPRTSGIPILALTAGVFLRPEEFLHSGCNEYLIKPFTINQLVTTIQRILKAGN
jgi:CheY-like chemotaxis protein